MVGFVVAGTQKGGTTALATFLLEHPEIALSTAKEPHFFDTEENFPGPAVDYAPYHAMYAPQPGQHLLGDRTPIYMYWKPAPSRIAAYNPAMKWIMLLRNPVTRAYSQWNMEVKQGRETLPFELAVRTEDERCRATLPLQHRRWSYVDRGRYSVQLARIAQHFPAAQILVLKSEELLTTIRPPRLRGSRSFSVSGPSSAPRGARCSRLPTTRRCRLPRASTSAKRWRPTSASSNVRWAGTAATGCGPS